MSIQSLCNMKCWVYSVTSTTNVYGGLEQTYTQKYSNVSCRARYLTGQESIIDGKEMNVPLWRIYIPGKLTILASDLIVDEKNRRWDILYVNRMNRKHHLQIDCQLISAIEGDACPNIIKSITASIITGDPGMIFDKYQTIDQNGSNSKDHFLPLYTYSTTGKTASDKTFFGDEGTGLMNTDYYQSLIINGTTYWLPIFKGSATSSCCSNLIGTIPTEV